MSSRMTRSMSRRLRDWASLPAPTIDRMVDVLKRTSRWRCDGPSLRILNKHWSNAVNHNVVSIRPHHTRTIVEEDILSLLKFRRLTSVDISPFLIDPADDASSEAFEENAVMYLSPWLGRQLERAIGVLFQLSHLRQLEMNYRTLSVFYHWCLGTKDLQPRFDTFRSLYCYSDQNLKLYGDTHLNMAWNYRSWPQRDASDMLKEVLGVFSAVNRLEVQANLLSSNADLSFLGRLDSVRLHGVQSMQLIEALPDPSAMISSLAVHGGGVVWERIASLNRMKSLAVSHDLSCLEHHQGFLQIFQQLKVLKLCCRGKSEAISGEVFRALDQLESLCLRSCRFSGRAVLGTMHRLLRLRLDDCWIEDGSSSFLHQMKNLVSLQWRGIIGIDNRPHGLSIFLRNLNELPRLRLLEVPSGILYNGPLLYTIAHLKNLEVLFLRLRPTVSLDRMSGLDVLPNLRILQIKCVSNPDLYETVIIPLLAFNVMTRLERLSLCANGCVTEGVKEHLRELKERAPQLIIELKTQPSCFENGSFDDDAFLV